jgi:GNAT superfamily N-acetyltransferase
MSWNLRTEKPVTNGLFQEIILQKKSPAGEKAMSLHFNLTQELVDQIIFAMENQNETFLLDTESLLFIPETGAALNANLIPLPSWKPSDGYQLMDSFTGIMKNPIYRERLRTILNTGHGVFRGFKNVIKERPDLEKAWFAHKDREMKRRVRLWYSSLCDYWGVESLGDEPEDIEDLFLDNFTMEDLPADSQEIQDIFSLMQEDLFLDYDPSLKEFLLENLKWDDRIPDYAVKALSPDGSSCGYISLFFEPKGDDLYGVLNGLYVLPEYRGAGIASGLLDHLSGYCFKRSVRTLLIQLPPEGEVLRANLQRRGFVICGSFLLLDVKKWYYEQQESY